MTDRSDDEVVPGLVLRREARASARDSGAKVRADGRVELATPAAARDVAERLRAETAPGRRCDPADLYAAAVFDAALRSLATRVADEVETSVEATLASVDGDDLEVLRESFLEQFGPGDEQSVDGDEEFLVNLVAVRLSNRNPAAGTIRRVVDDEGLEPGDVYDSVVETMRSAGGSEGDGGGGRVFDELFRLVESGPGSWVEQFEAMADRWGELLPAAVSRQLARAADLVREKQRVRRRGGPPAPEPPELGAFESGGDYSDDHDWMEDLVVVAKNALVWLEQLDRRYAASVETLADVPHEALERLSEFGLDCLWLIGIWERSLASRRIKRLAGRPEAAASAYAIRNYRVSERLGGWEAKEELERRAADHGVRLAADMVPNHTGLDADWVVERPEWFVSLEEPPFGSYSFEGPDLADDESVELRIEDGYYDRTDAAVVFEHRDAETGETRYLYHGNDGTETPWNDTAQLDFLQEEVRDAVVETIVEVAREFSVLRFDAAMVLAREQIRRLWHPRPGEGGAIPSRSEHGVDEETFDHLMPDEFWRRVVEEVEERAPGTLLMAEAFWKMEGYFVRSLGMHRVYNSAFMDMLRDEKNGEFHELVEETLRHDPRTLKRYVNYLNNPDEETALEQFGDGDQYFGACVVMATLPGLPMFGHGQIEGLSENYGMDFDAPLIDESPDPEMVARHRREIAPLLDQRSRFAGIDDFWWLEVQTADGEGVDDVFAFANGAGIESSLVVYHNHFGDVRAFVQQAVPRRDPASDGLETATLADVLPVELDGAGFLAFEDALQDESFLRPLDEVRRRGLAVALGPYEARVFESFRRVEARSDGRLEELVERIGLEGVSSLEDELHDLRLEPVRRAFRALVGPDVVEPLALDDESAVNSGLIRRRIGELVEAVDELMDVTGEGVVEETVAGARAVKNGLSGEILDGASPEVRIAVAVARLVGPFLESLADEGASRPRRVLERLRVLDVAEEAVAAAVPSEARGAWELTVLLFGAPAWTTDEGPAPSEVVDWLLGDDRGRAYLGLAAGTGEAFDVAAARRAVAALAASTVARFEAVGKPGDGLRRMFERVVEALEESSGRPSAWRAEFG